VQRHLRGLAHGRLTVVDPLGRTTFGEGGGPPAATVSVHDLRFYAALLFGGSIGAAESYMRAEWSADDLTSLLRLMLREEDVADRLESLGRIPAWTLRWRPRANTIRGARRNVAAHYDIGNDFFSLVLDPTLSYSCALFGRDGMSLEEASRAKMERVCRLLALSPRDHLMEIGGGWGALAMHAARHFGCRVTTTTVSRRQYELACRRVHDAGLSHRVRVLLEDYRRLEGRYSKLAAIEMIEAVGYENYDAFFRRCSDLLAPDGVMLLQAIVIDDRLFERARRSIDFIKRYIFPGGCLPSIGAVSSSVARASDLRVVRLEELTSHYPPTLRWWRRRLLANADGLRRLGFSEGFLRMWDFYFCYCEAGFLERRLGDVQLVLTKPLARVDPPRPASHVTDRRRACGLE
jgi:cyclopropane-fatty-acyl-phospholipid synthase